MPEGHLPVRSYLAVSVVSRDGTVLGGLFFGHPEPCMFTVDSELNLNGLAGEAAVAIDNFRLFEEAQREIAERRRVEAALRDLNRTWRSRSGGERRISSRMWKRSARRRRWKQSAN